MDGIPDVLLAPLSAGDVARPPAGTGRDSAARPARQFNGYLVALVAPAGLLGIRLALDNVLQASSPFLFFAPAVMISAWFGGRGPGLLATVAGALAANYFL